MDILNQILAYIANLISQAIVWVTQGVQSILNHLNVLTTAITNFVGPLIQRVGEIMAQLAGTLKTFLENAISTIVNFVEQAFVKLLAVTQTVLDKIGVFINNIIAGVQALMSNAVNVFAGLFIELVNRAREIAEGVLERLSAVATAVKDKLLEWLDVLIEFALEALENVTQAIARVLDVLFTDVNSGLAALVGKIEALRTGFDELATDITDKLGVIAEEQLTPIREAIKTIGEFFTQALTPEEAETALVSLDRLVKGPLSPELLNEFFGEGWYKFAPKSGFGAHVFFGLAALIGAAQFFINAGQIQSQVAIQDVALKFPFAVIPPADAAQAWRRGALDRDEAKEAIQRQGFSGKHAHAMLDNTAQVPNEGELLASWLRGEIADETLSDALFQRGYSAAWQTRLRELAQLIPPVQDLILMAVREAFSPEIAQRFGQYENYPEPLSLWAKKQGLTEEWAKRYWAAHWSLPSVQMGYEMLHRKVIGPEDLELLLRAQDVMPFWRQKLIDISYAVYTRVDIRRMHQVGVLKDSDLLKAHMDLGYDEAHASRLSEFVLLLNKGGPSDEPEELGKLSRTSILGFYSDGVLTRDRAKALLVQFGHTAEAAELYLLGTDADRQRVERKTEIGLIIEQAEAGILTFEAAADRLRALKLETVEVERALTQLLRAQQKKNKLPSQSDGEGFFIAGLIGQQDYDDLLSRLGYAQRWRQVFIAEAGRKKGGGRRT